MAEESPLSATGSLTEYQYEALAAPQAPDGLNGNPGDPPPVSVSGGQVIVREGLKGVLRGFPWASTSPTVYTPSLTGAPRVDLVVLRLNRDDNFRVGTAIRTGSGDTAPTPFNGTGPTDWYEIPLAEVRMSGGALSVQRTRAWYLGEDGQIICTVDSRPPHLPGRYIYEQDTGRAYISTGVRWVPVLDDAGTTTPSLAAGWAASGLYLFRLNGIAYMAGGIRRTGGTLTPSAAAAPLLTLPNGYRPRVTFGHASNVSMTGAQAVLRFAPTGAITVDVYGANITANQFIDLATCVWPVALN
ncbi:hypothetical protein [Krasilnikovia sp. MM14-A1259]|uniref:hypothetical protein n=1 Tax=Krasilnikovia sp. MM14-A1259 TaxID=3373539 RepID=UPI00382E1754